MVSQALPLGPTGTLVSGCANEFKRDPLGFLTRGQNEFGNVFSFRVGLSPVLFINEPDLIQSVLVTDAAKFTKDIALRNNRKFFGQGLLSSEGKLWKQQRKLMSPAFDLKHLEVYGQIMVDHTKHMLERWQNVQTVDIQHEMMELTLGIVAKTLFDVELDATSKELEMALIDAQKYLSLRMNDPLAMMLPEWLPLETNVQLHKAIQTVDKVVWKLIEERRSTAGRRQDLLSILLSTRGEDGTSMSDQQVRDEIFTLLFAGHETTALTLTWSLHLLSQNPVVEEKLLVEIQQVLNGRRPTVRDYGYLSYTGQVIKESMRAIPPVWMIGREAVCDCTIGNYSIPKGTTILLSQWVTHHDARFYERPECFEPDRWTDEFINNLPKFAYFPFGGGSRICVGNGFAMLEAVLLLAYIIQKYHLAAVPGQLLELLPAVTLRSANGINMTLYKRE